jgi:streptogramin lyase
MSLRVPVLAAVLMVAGGCAAGSGSSETADPGSSVAATPVGASHPPTMRGTLIRTAQGPVGVTVDTRGRVWVANADAGSVSRINAAGDGVDVTTAVGTAPLRLAATTGSVWVTVFSDGKLVRLDDRTGHVADTLPVGAEPEGVAAAFGAVWVVSQASGQLLRIDPDRLTIVDRYPVGVSPRLVTSGAGVLWVSDFGSGRVFRVDPATGKVRKSGALCFGPQGMAVAAHTLWVACTTDETLVGVDPQTMKATSSTPLKGAPDAITTGPGGLLLVALQKGPTLAVVDPVGPRVVRRDRLGSMDQLYGRANIDVGFTSGRAWVSSYLEGGIYRTMP